MPVRDLLSAASSQGAAPSDPYFEYNTLLLNGDGTNGAQNNTFLDSSTNNFTITRNGNTTQGSFSPYGTLWSNYFDGSGDNLSLNGTAVGTSNSTVEFFIFPTDSSTTYRAIFDSRSTAGTNTGFGIFQYGLTIEVYGNGLKVSSAASALNINQWNHVALTRSSGTCQLYINGVASGSSGSYSDNLTSTVVKIGDTPSGTAFPYLGYISNLRVVIGSVVYTGSYTVPTTPLTAISGTSLLTCQSNRFIDNSSNAFAITVAGNTSVQRFSPFNPTAPYSTSVIGGSGYFDGSGDYLTTPTTGQFAPTGDFTVGIWVYPLSLAAASAVVGNYVSNVSTDWVIDITTAGAVRYYTSGATVRITSATGAVKINQWSYISLSRSGTTLTGYVNGTSAGTYTQSGTFGSATKTIYIGIQSGSSEPLTGYLSDVKLIDGSAVTTVPTAPQTATTGTNLLLSMTNAGIPDLAMMNNLETVGNAQVSTSVKKYGTGSLAFDGTGDWLTTIDTPNLQLGTGNFTIEGWVYLNAIGSARGFVSKGTSTTGWSLGTNALNQVVFSYASSSITSTSTLLVSTWYFITVVREGTSTNQTKIYINGTNDGTGTVSTDFNQTNIMYVGADRVGGSALNGYIDDLRITKGLARYTANFTAPTSALPTY